MGKVVERECQQEAAKASMWEQLMAPGTSLAHLATMGAMDVQPFALRSGELQHEKKKGKWQSVFAILWRDPAVHVDATEEMALLLYEDDQADAPLLALPLRIGDGGRWTHSVTPPKTARKSWAHCFRISAGKVKLILGADSAADYSGWVSALLLDAEAKQKLRTATSREASLEAEESRARSEERALRKLAKRMRSQGLEKTLTKAKAATFANSALQQGWIRRETRQNTFSRAWAVLWEPGEACGVAGDDPSEWSGWPSTDGVVDRFLLVFEGPEAEGAQTLYRLAHGAVSVGQPKKERTACQHCIRVDSAGATTFKLVLGTDAAEDTAAWRQWLEK